VLDPAAIAAVHDEVLDEVAAAIAYADASPEPEVSSLTEDVYSSPIRIGAHA
jgi:TPP-dependent pyruvate/acetoin dehydrogenase alpha subunit